jgi:hypothetical protein
MARAADAPRTSAQPVWRRSCIFFVDPRSSDRVETSDLALRDCGAERSRYKPSDRFVFATVPRCAPPRVAGRWVRPRPCGLHTPEPVASGFPDRLGDVSRGAADETMKARRAVVAHRHGGRPAPFVRTVAGTLRPPAAALFMKRRATSSAAAAETSRAERRRAFARCRWRRALELRLTSDAGRRGGGCQAGGAGSHWPRGGTRSRWPRAPSALDRR